MDKISRNLLTYLAAIATAAKVDSNYSDDMENKIHDSMIEYDNKLQNDINIISGQKSSFMKNAEGWCQLYTDEKKKSDLYRESLDKCFSKLLYISIDLDSCNSQNSKPGNEDNEENTRNFIEKIKGELK